MAMYGLKSMVLPRLKHFKAIFRLNRQQFIKELEGKKLVDINKAGLDLEKSSSITTYRHF